ncbi:uncharacterized protein LOC131252923 isoform X2 [Magnolia sinica]|uniref:uncharacterized protein LOC131252923 isoform X2 n=1 Tax=Magnolia sinica TaxID=86752 RepID=UPI0026581694|nr:uncharacterized protein LOC131252923 isoform X2 [Magnolia sinica]
MASSSSSIPLFDTDLDDAELWAVIDSAAASRSSKTLALKHANHQNFIPAPKPKRTYTVEEDPRVSADGEVLQEPWARHQQRPQKIARSCEAGFGEDNRIVVVNHLQRTPPTPKIPRVYSSPDSGRFSVQEMESSPYGARQIEEKENARHSLSGRFPSVSLFKQYQNAAMAILEKTDYTMISGNPFIKKSGWRKISFFFNLSFEIKDKSIEFDDNRNVLRSEFVVRASMQIFLELENTGPVQAMATDSLNICCVCMYHSSASNGH